jgi:hypothetical protein
MRALAGARRSGETDKGLTQAMVPEGPFALVSYAEGHAG